MPLKLACPCGCRKWIGAELAADLLKPIRRCIPRPWPGSMAGLACRNGWPEASAWLLSLLALWLLVRLGQRLLGADAGWWGGLLFAVLPLSVFYGRSIQPESLLLACSALALERGLAWRHSGHYSDLALASGGLTGAVLIKVLPALWLGLPLLWLAWLRHGPDLLRRLELWLVAGVVLGLTGAWYWHAHQLFLQTGLSFGFWGAGANRYSWGELIGPGYWGNLLLRTSVRGLAVLGLPLLVIGLLNKQLKAEARLLPIGLVSVLVAGALAPESSGVHEYYQLPLLLFARPLMGLGWVQLWQQAGRRSRRWLTGAMALLLGCSLVVLNLEYWAKEVPEGNPTWGISPANPERNTARGADHQHERR